MNLFAAASAAGSTVRTVAVKSSTLVYGASAPRPERVPRGAPRGRSRPARPSSGASLEVEGYVRDFAEDNPHVTVSMLRFSNVLGSEIRTPLSKALSLPVVPRIFGFDPRFQFVHEDDVIRAILFVLEHNLPGIYNVAGDGLLPWSEVAGICGKRTFPLPPFGFRGIASTPLSRLGIELTPELLDLMRYGRGVDNRRLKAAGFQLRLHVARAPSRRSCRRCGCATPSAPTPTPTATSATSSSSSATRRRWCGSPTST